MTITRVSITSVSFGTSAEARAAGVSFRTTSFGTVSASSTGEVAWASLSPDCLRVYRPFLTGQACYFVRAEASGSAISTRDADAAPVAARAMMEGALGTVIAGEGVTVTSFAAGYYSDGENPDDGYMDILLNFSDGTHALISTSGDSDAPSVLVMSPPPVRESGEQVANEPLPLPPPPVNADGSQAVRSMIASPPVAVPVPEPTPEPTPEPKPEPKPIEEDAAGIDPRGI